MPVLGEPWPDVEEVKLISGLNEEREPASLGLGFESGVLK
jgi:hypothetical protein